MEILNSTAYDFSEEKDEFTLCQNSPCNGHFWVRTRDWDEHWRWLHSEIKGYRVMATIFISLDEAKGTENLIHLAKDIISNYPGNVTWRIVEDTSQSEGI